MNTVLKGRIALTTIFRPFWRLKFANAWYANVSNKKTRFVTSSGAENYLTLYNTSVRSNKSNVNSSSFTTETNLFFLSSTCFCYSNYSSLDNIFEYIVSFQKKKFHFSPYLVGRRNEKMDVKVVFLGKWLPISYAIFLNLGFRKSSSRMLFMPLRL